MANGDSEQERQKAILHLEEARWRRNDQAERQEGLNRRLTTLFALNFAVLAVLGASLRYGELILPSFLEYCVYAAIFVLVGNVAILLWAFRLGRGVRRPDLRRLHELASSEYSSATMTHWVAVEVMLAMEANEPRLADKGRWITIALRTSAAAVLLVALVIALALRFAEPRE